MGSGGAKKAARIQAQATREAAEAQMKQAREAARGAQLQQEHVIARQKIAENAKAAEDAQLKQTVEVDLAPDVAETETDEMGRRRRPRDLFRTPSGSGLSL